MRKTFLISVLALIVVCVSGACVTVTSEEHFNQLMVKASKNLAFFSAGDWCGPCTQAEAKFNEFKDTQLNCVKVNCDALPDLANKHKAFTVPMFVVRDQAGKTLFAGAGYPQFNQALWTAVL